MVLSFDETMLPRPVERVRLVLCCAAAWSFTASATLAWTSTQAWNVAHTPSLLGVRYVLAGPVVALAMWLWWYTLGRARQDRVIGVGSVALAVALLALRASYLAQPGGPFAMAALGVALMVDLIAIASIAELSRAVFSESEERRLGWCVGLAAGLGPVLAGVVVAIVAPWAHVDQLLAVAALFQVTAAGATFALGRAHRGRFAPDRTLAPPEAPVIEDLARLWNGRLAWSIGTYAVLLIAAYTMADALLAGSFAERHANEARLLRFYGAFLAWGSLIAGGIRGVLSRTVLERYGVMVGLVVLPASLCGALGAVVVTSGASWAVTAARMMPLVFGVASTVAMRLMYLPIARDFRPRATAIARHFVVPTATTLAGFGALLFGPTPTLAVVSSVFAIGAGVAGVVGWHEWTLRLAGALRPMSDSVPPVDPGARPALALALNAGDPSRVLHALDLIGTTDDLSVWADDLVMLLGHTSALVRARALGLIGHTPRRSQLEAVRSRLSDPEPEVRAAAIGACFELAGAQSVGDARAMLTDPHPAVRSAVVEGLMRHGSGEGARLAGEELRRMVASEEPRLRAAAARGLGSFYAPPMRAMLIGLLEDPSPEVRSAAISVAGTSADAALLPKLVIALRDRRTAGAAARALARFKEGIEADLGYAVDDERRPPETRAQVARIIGRMGTRLGVEVLTTRIGVAHGLVRTSVHASLARIAEGPGLVAPAELLEAAVVDEIRDAEEWLNRWVDIGGTSAHGGLLEEALRIRKDASVERVFLLLRARWPRHASGLTRTHADWVARRGTPKGAADRVLTLVRGDQRERLGKVLLRTGTPSRTAASVVERLLTASDPWLRVAAVEHIGRARLMDLVPVLNEMAAEEPEPLLAQAITLTLQILEGRPREDGVLNDIEKVLVLKRVPLLDGLPAEQLVSVAQIARPVRFDAGVVVFRKGDVGDSVYLVIHGEAVVQIGEKVVARLGAGEVFGEMALLDAEPRSATVASATSLSTLRIGRDEFQDLIEDHPEVLRGIVRVLTQRIRLALAQ